MTQFDFWLVIGKWNQYFDGHTAVGWPNIPDSKNWKEGQCPFPPPCIIQYREKKIFFGNQEGLPDSIKNCEILTINGYQNKEIINHIMPYVSHESERYINSSVLKSLSWFYKALYGYTDHLAISYMTKNGEKKIIMNRDMVLEWLGIENEYSCRQNPWNFKLYPELGMALLALASL